MNTWELPLTQPDRSTISWTTEARSGVLWSGPACPSVVHAAGVQCTDAVVFAREDTFPAAAVKVRALSASSPLMVREVEVEDSSWTLNWMWAFVIVALLGMVRLLKRMPTVWLKAPSTVSSRSGPLSDV